ncbi:hemoglobin [Bradyrhizobium sp. i1.4.4]
MSDRLKAEREAAAARRNLLTQDAIERTGITEEMIGELVTRFYGRVREDALLGPVFAIVQNWDEHLAKLKDFWSSVVLMSGRYHGSPMRAHVPLSLVGDHFDRWLDLFEQTAREVCPPPAAALFIDKARRIADSFEMASSATIAGRIAAPRHVLRS